MQKIKLQVQWGALVAFAVAVVGCATIEKVATPARIEAVSALAAYQGAKVAISNGHASDIQKALDALKIIQASGKVDLAAVVVAIRTAGVKLDVGDGGLAVDAGLIVFSDYWASSVENVVEDARARAVVNGCVRGFGLALNAPRSGPGDSQRDSLVRDVEKTRPSRR